MRRPTPDEITAFLQDAFPSAARAGTRCESIGDGTAVARIPYAPDRVRPGGYISGPTIFGAADIALWFACFSVIGIEPMAVTSELSIRFVRPARNGDLLARATLQSIGRRRLVGTVDMWIDGAEDRLVAVAQGTYVRPSPGP